RIATAQYAALFLSGTFIGMALHTDQTATTPSETAFAVGIACSVFLTALCAVWYFASSAVQPSPLSGLLYGTTSIVVAAVLDVSIITFAQWNTGTTLDMASYYADIHFCFGVIFTLVTALIAGYVRGERTKETR
ncbi:MAG: hypothetical protein KBD66_03090, partial [Candidatus Doudnabacteria bacterium]|nr:hypothetical protein [Candidatus Doudnabacteria bacterium]